jgi:hypothetical protein
LGLLGQKGIEKQRCWLDALLIGIRFRQKYRAKREADASLKGRNHLNGTCRT